jgi:hypothetical protein
MYDYFLPLVGPNGLSIGRTHMPKFLRIGVHQSNVGLKWHYELADQLDNFTNANNALMTALDHHGQL